MERLTTGSNGAPTEWSCFDSLLSALRYTNGMRHERLTGVYVTHGPDKRYYVTYLTDLPYLRSLGHEVIAQF